MIDGIDDLILHATWRDRPLTGAQYIAWVKGLMVRLAEVDPRLRELYVMADSVKKCVLVHAESPELDKAIVANLDHDVRYVRPGGEQGGGADQGKFTLESTSPLGFQTALTTTLKAIPGVTVSCNLGRKPLSDTEKRHDDFVHVEFNANSPLCAIAKQVFEAIVQYARPEHADLWRVSVKPYPKQPMRNRSVGWLTYFADPAVGRLVPAGTRVEALADGVLIQASDKPPMPADSQEVAAISSIFAALHAAGVLER